MPLKFKDGSVSKKNYTETCIFILYQPEYLKKKV